MLMRHSLSACALLFSLSVIAAQAKPHANITVQHNVIYGVMDGVKLPMDMYSPLTVKAHPAIVFIHGGAWISGDKTFYTGMCQEMARHGYVCATINYRMLPKYHYPAELDDCQLAVRYLRANAAKYHVDPLRIGALGDSAGGYLVALLGLRDTRDKSAPLQNFSSRVEAVADFYGPTDFTQPLSTASPLAISLVEAFLNGKPTTIPKVFRKSSPIVYVDKTAPPFLILHGTADNLVPYAQSTELADALHKLGDNATLLGVYGAGHAFLNGSQPGIYLGLCESFFDGVLRPKRK